MKIGYAEVCQDSYYLIWDADTIPIRPIEFLDGDVMLFNRKEEHHLPYFATMDTLFRGKLRIDANGGHPSFISEGMIIDCSIMREMIQQICKEAGSKNAFWEIIVDAIPLSDLYASGFSEFETYGTYLLNYHPERYRERRLFTQRKGYSEFGRRLTVDEMRTLPYDTISFEAWDRPSWKQRVKRFLKRMRLRL